MVFLWNSETNYFWFDILGNFDWQAIAFKFGEADFIETLHSISVIWVIDTGVQRRALCVWEFICRWGRIHCFCHCMIVFAGFAWYIYPYPRGLIHWHGVICRWFVLTILADDIFNCVFLNENDRIPIQISLKYVPRSPNDNKPALVQVMAWRRSGDKPLAGPMMTQFIDAYMRH